MFQSTLQISRPATKIKLGTQHQERVNHKVRHRSITTSPSHCTLLNRSRSSDHAHRILCASCHFQYYPIVYRLISTYTIDMPFGKWFGYEVLTGAGVGVGFRIPIIAVQTVLPLKDVHVGTACVIFFQSLGGVLFNAGPSSRTGSFAVLARTLWMWFLIFCWERVLPRSGTSWKSWKVE